MHQVDHGAGADAGRCRADEFPPPRAVASHGQQAAQRVGVHRRHQRRDPAPQFRGLRRARRARLVGDLLQVPDDHLVVRLDRLVLVDGAGNQRGFEHRRRAAWRGAGSVVASKGRLRQADPELRRAAAWRLVFSAAILHDLQAADGQRIQGDVRPGHPLHAPLPAERSGIAGGILRNRRHDAPELVDRGTGAERERRELVAVKAVGQGAQAAAAARR